MSYDLTWSMISCWRTCHRKFWFEYEECIIPGGPNFNFFTGSLLHLMVNEFHKGKDIDEVRELLYQHGNTLLLKYLSVFWCTSEDEIEMRRLVDLVQTIADSYYKKYKKDKYIVLSCENIYRMPLLEDINLAGIIDEVVRQNKKKVYIYEIKSTKSIDSDFISKYAIDGQTMTYQILADWNGHQINGTILDCIRKPQIRQGKKESDESYMTRLMTLYEVEIDNYFYSDMYPINVRLVKEHFRSLKETASEIINIRGKDMKDYVINAKNCYLYGKCPYLPLCLNGDNQMMRALFIHKSHRNMELVDGKIYNEEE